MADPPPFDLDGLPPEEGGFLYAQLPGAPLAPLDPTPPVIAPPAPRPEAPPPAAPPPLARILEAMLFLGGSPLTAVRACEVIRNLTPPQFLEGLDVLNRDYRRQGRPYHVVRQDPGWVLALRPRFQAVRERLTGGPREARLSQAAVDVLALVAYRQPLTKPEVDSLRGQESGGVLRSLVRLGLLAVSGRTTTGGAEVTYATTGRFLELFNLTSLDDLPVTQDLQRM